MRKAGIKQVKEQSGSIKAIIFDMDGTVIDSTESDYMAWKRIFAEYNTDIAYDEYVKVLGVKSDEILQRFLSLDGEELHKALKRKLHYFNQIIEEQGLASIPHVENFLKQLKDSSLRVALATGARKEKSDYVLDKVNLKRYFETFTTAEDIRNGKPHPEIFLKAAARMNVSPSQCIVVEDAENGVKAAKNAGMHCVAITTTTNRDILKDADLIIDSFRDISIAALLERFSGGQDSIS